MSFIVGPVLFAIVIGLFAPAGVLRGRRATPVTALIVVSGLVVLTLDVLTAQMKAVNDGVRFVLELCALAAIAYWGWRTGGSTATKLLLAVGGVVLVAVVWGVFRSESDAVVEVPTAVRIIIEVTVFAAATAALAAVGRVGLAVAFAVVAGINEILNYTLDQVERLKLWASPDHLALRAKGGDPDVAAGQLIRHDGTGASLT